MRAADQQPSGGFRGSDGDQVISHRCAKASLRLLGRIRIDDGSEFRDNTALSEVFA
jgi:hypothetical protein